MSLIARHLEQNGIPTIIVGSAKDIVEVCGVPRFLFVDFPLGNPCGRPDDRAMQERIVHQSLELLSEANEPNTTVLSAEVWDNQIWRENYMRVDDGNREELAKRGAELRIQRQSRVKRDES